MFGGTSQEIEITTSPPGANCALERAGKIVGRVNPTPGATMVAKSRKDITVTCTKENYADATGYSDSGVEPWVFMNLVFGGLIGLGIDHATGGVNEYDPGGDHSCPGCRRENLTSRQPTQRRCAVAGRAGIGGRPDVVGTQPPLPSFTRWNDSGTSPSYWKSAFLAGAESASCGLPNGLAGRRRERRLAHLYP